MLAAALNQWTLRNGAIALVLVASLSACMVGPDYRRPEVDVPAAWRLGATEAVEISNIAWWDQFDDPILSNLVRTALANNKDLEIAAANVDQAAAQYGIVRSAQFPQVNGGVSVARERSSANAPLPGGRTVNDYAVNLSASFELDIWGKLRRATESARAGLLASQQGKGTVVLTVVATVASGYIQLRALDRQLEIAQYTSQSLGEAARLQRVRFEEGAVPQSDYLQAESQYRDAVARVPELEREIARQENFLSVLLGHNPGPIPRGRDIDALLFPNVPEGLPASLLERRPDIRQAEQNLIAANANIGVARAAYFPDISLTALLGLESALIDRTKFGQVREEQAKNVEALRRFRDLADLRYREGATIYLEVANAEQSLFNAQLAYVATQAQLFQSYANLYKAIGGGWVEETERLTSRGD